MTVFKPLLHRVANDEDGAVIVEYVLLLLLIAMVALVAMQTFGGVVSNKMGNSNNSVANAIGS